MCMYIVMKCYVEKKASALSIAPRHAASSTQVSIGSRPQQMVQLATRQNVASTTRGAVAPSSVPSSQIFSRYTLNARDILHWSQFELSLLCLLMFTCTVSQPSQCNLCNLYALTMTYYDWNVYIYCLCGLTCWGRLHFFRSPPKKPLIGDFEDKENLFTDWFVCFNCMFMFCSTSSFVTNENFYFLSMYARCFIV